MLHGLQVHVPILLIRKVHVLGLVISDVLHVSSYAHHLANTVTHGHTVVNTCLPRISVPCQVSA